MIIPLREPVPCEVYYKDKWQEALFTHRDFKQDPDTLDWHDDLIIRLIETGEDIVLPDMTRMRLGKGNLFANYTAKSIKLAGQYFNNLTLESKKRKKRRR